MELITSDPIPLVPFSDRARFDAICEAVANGTTARKALLATGVNWATFWRWLNTNDHAPQLRKQYALARDSLMDYWAEDITDIAEDQTRDLQPDGKGGYKSDNTAVNRDKLRVDSRKWLLSKLKPERYGDLQRIEHTGAGGAPIQLVVGARKVIDTIEDK